jgi:hypothetical protein
MSLVVERPVVVSVTEACQQRDDAPVGHGMNAVAGAYDVVVDVRLFILEALDEVRHEHHRTSEEQKRIQGDKYVPNNHVPAFQVVASITRFTLTRATPA